MNFEFFFTDYATFSHSSKFWSFFLGPPSIYIYIQPLEKKSYSRRPPIIAVIAVVGNYRLLVRFRWRAHAVVDTNPVEARRGVVAGRWSRASDDNPTGGDRSWNSGETVSRSVLAIDVRRGKWRLNRPCAERMIANDRSRSRCEYAVVVDKRYTRVFGCFCRSSRRFPSKRKRQQRWRQESVAWIRKRVGKRKIIASLKAKTAFDSVIIIIVNTRISCP